MSTTKMALRPCASAARNYASRTVLLILVTFAAACSGDVVVAPLTGLRASAAVERENLIISTQKPLGPVPGTFTTSGAFVESGVMVTERRTVSAIPSPFGVVTHLVLLFQGQQGTFRIRTEITETVTDDENIFANSGSWVIVDGTGAYSALRGTGTIEGTVDDTANLITRVFTGLVIIR